MILTELCLSSAVSRINPVPEFDFIANSYFIQHFVSEFFSEELRNYKGVSCTSNTFR